LQALGAEQHTPKAVVPPGPTLARPKGISALAPRVLLATEETLRVRTDLLAELSLSARDVAAGLRSSTAAAYWLDEASGVPLVLVVAKDRQALRRAASELGSRPSLPAPGWTAITFVMAENTENTGPACHDRSSAGAGLATGSPLFFSDAKCLSPRDSRGSGR
jgi:hypothetical protein